MMVMMIGPIQIFSLVAVVAVEAAVAAAVEASVSVSNFEHNRPRLLLLPRQTPLPPLAPKTLILNS